MSKSFQNEVPPTRINIKLDLHTGGAQKKVELPLKLLVTGDYGRDKNPAALIDRKKVSINKNNFDAVLAEFNPQATITVKNTIAQDNSEMNVNLDFKKMADFHPEQVARNIPELRALLAMRNLLRDLKSNVLDNALFRKELEKILQDDSLSQTLRSELEKIAPLTK